MKCTKNIFCLLFAYVAVLSTSTMLCLPENNYSDFDIQMQPINRPANNFSDFNLEKERINRPANSFSYFDIEKQRINRTEPLQPETIKEQKEKEEKQLEQETILNPIEQNPSHPISYYQPVAENSLQITLNKTNQEVRELREQQGPVSFWDSSAVKNQKLDAIRNIYLKNAKELQQYWNLRNVRRIIIPVENATKNNPNSFTFDIVKLTPDQLTQLAEYQKLSDPENINSLTEYEKFKEEDRLEDQIKEIAQDIATQQPELKLNAPQLIQYLKDYVKTLPQALTPDKKELVQDSNLPTHTVASDSIMIAPSAWQNSTQKESTQTTTMINNNMNSDNTELKDQLKKTINEKISDIKAKQLQYLLKKNNEIAAIRKIYQDTINDKQQTLNKQNTPKLIIPVESESRDNIDSFDFDIVDFTPEQMKVIKEYQASKKNTKNWSQDSIRRNQTLSNMVTLASEIKKDQPTIKLSTAQLTQVLLRYAESLPEKMLHVSEQQTTPIEVKPATGGTVTQTEPAAQSDSERSNITIQNPQILNESGPTTIPAENQNSAESSAQNSIDQPDSNQSITPIIREPEETSENIDRKINSLPAQEPEAADIASAAQTTQEPATPDATNQPEIDTSIPAAEQQENTTAPETDTFALDTTVQTAQESDTYDLNPVKQTDQEPAASTVTNKPEIDRSTAAGEEEEEEENPSTKMVNGQGTEFNFLEGIQDKGVDKTKEIQAIIDELDQFKITPDQLTTANINAIIEKWKEYEKYFKELSLKASNISDESDILLAQANTKLKEIQENYFPQIREIVENEFNKEIEQLETSNNKALDAMYIRTQVNDPTARYFLDEQQQQAIKKEVKQILADDNMTNEITKRLLNDRVSPNNFYNEITNYITEKIYDKTNPKSIINVAKNSEEQENAIEELKKNLNSEIATMLNNRLLYTQNELAQISRSGRILNNVQNNMLQVFNPYLQRQIELAIQSKKENIQNPINTTIPDASITQSDIEENLKKELDQGEIDPEQERLKQEKEEQIAQDRAKAEQQRATIRSQRAQWDKETITWNNSLQPLTREETNMLQKANNQRIEMFSELDDPLDQYKIIAEFIKNETTLSKMLQIKLLQRGDFYSINNEQEIKELNQTFETFKKDYGANLVEAIKFILAKNKDATITDPIQVAKLVCKVIKMNGQIPPKQPDSFDIKLQAISKSSDYQEKLDSFINLRQSQEFKNKIKELVFEAEPNQTPENIIDQAYQYAKSFNTF